MNRTENHRKIKKAPIFPANSLSLHLYTYVYVGRKKYIVPYKIESKLFTSGVLNRWSK